MSNHLSSAIRPAIVMTLLLGGLLGIVYPLAITGVAQVAMPSQANGSLVRDGDRVVGSTVVGQAFASERYLRGSLERAGYDVGEAATARDALQQVATFDPAVVLLDLGLPDREGMELVR